MCLKLLSLFEIANSGKLQRQKQSTLDTCELVSRPKDDAAECHMCPRMRSLNAHGTYKSNWDPQTNLMYIVREDVKFDLTVPPFETHQIKTLMNYH